MQQPPLWAVWLRHTDKNQQKPWQVWERLPDGRERQVSAHRTVDQARKSLTLSGGQR